MKLPSFLSKGDTIYLVAPSFGCTTEPYHTRLNKAIKNLNDDGYKIIIGNNCYKAILPYASNTKELRAKEFMDAYKSNAKVIFSVGGGEMMNEILPFIDFEEIKNLPPKWFVGFSDNTNLTYTLTTITHTMSLYAINAPDFAFKPYKDATLDTLLLLQGKKNIISGYKYFEKEKNKSDNPLAPLNLTNLKTIKAYNKDSEISGRLLGGNLDILRNLCGTKYDQTKKFIEEIDEPIIWFLEACDLSPLDIKRAIFQLSEAGWFKTACCFLIGRSLCMDQEIFGVNAYNAYDQLKEISDNVFLDVDLGHMAPSMPMICGALATIKYKSKHKLEIIYKL